MQYQLSYDGSGDFEWYPLHVRVDLYSGRNIFRFQPDSPLSISEAGRMPWTLGTPIFIQWSAGATSSTSPEIYVPGAYDPPEASFDLSFQFQFFEEDAVTPVELTTIPEPSSVSLALLALAAVLLMRFRPRDSGNSR
jgi:hypothetical protein